jgi:hypothetical protein
MDDFDTAEIAYVPTTGVARVHHTPLVIASDKSLKGCIHPNVWHGAVVPLDDHAELLDRQGRVHARVSVDFAREFGCYLGVPMRKP